MVKQGFCFDGRSELHGFNGGLLTAIRSLDYIVEPIVRPFDGAFGDEFVLIHKKMHVPMLLTWCKGIPRRPESR